MSSKKRAPARGGAKAPKAPTGKELLEDLVRAGLMERREFSLPGYRDLCDTVYFPRAIRSEEEHEELLGVIEHLMYREDLSAEQELYLDTLATIVEGYEKHVTEGALPAPSPTDMLRSYCDGHGVTAAELGRLLGDDSRSLGSKLLNGKRTPSIAHAKILAKRFDCSPATFLGA